MRHLRLLAGCIALVAGSGIAALVGAAPAGAAACSGTSGVTVIVDFGSLGGGTQVRCAPGDPRSGLEALQAAGFSYGFTNVPGLVCTIDNRPDPCNGAPSDAYWAYYHAPKGGSWSYSNEGAGTYDPAPGSVEGWAFGAKKAPSVAPPAATPTTTRPPTTPPPTTPPNPTPTSEPAAVLPDTTGSPTGASGDQTTTTARADSATTTTARDSTSTTRAASSDPSTTTTDDPDELAVERSSSEGGGGPDGDDGDLGALLGVVVVIAVTGGAAWELRRRRSSP